jgi:hypothetical protein
MDGMGRVDSLIPLLARARTDSGDNPDRVDKAWYVTQESQHNVQPRMQPQSNLQKNSEGWQQHSEKDSQQVHEFSFLRGQLTGDASVARPKSRLERFSTHLGRCNRCLEAGEFSNS